MVAEADFAGSTSGMIAYAKDTRPAKVIMLTECSMSDNVAAETPGVEFIRPCNLCPHMKRITLANILECLETGQYEVKVDPSVAEAAKDSVEAMLRLAPPKAKPVTPSVAAE